MPSQTRITINIHQAALLTGLLIIGGLFAWNLRFVQDDAFISFVYAENLHLGKGLVWNNEVVEGYTNFLWTVLLSATLSISDNIVAASFALGIAFFLLSIITFYFLSGDILNNSSYPFLGIILLITNYSFISFATGGLETSLQTFLLVMCTYLSVFSARNEKWTAKHLIIISILFTLSVLNRLDSVILLLPLSLFILLHLLDRYSFANTAKKIAVLALPFLAVFPLYLYFKMDFYGEILPNTYYAKGHFSIHKILRGSYYVFIFMLLHFYIFLIPLYLSQFKTTFKLVVSREMSIRKSTVVLLASGIILWSGYVAWAGGDFMEFRLLVPIIPIWILLSLMAIENTNHKAKKFYIGMLLIGNFAAVLYTEYLGTQLRVVRKGFMSVSALDIRKTAWDVVGKKLGEYFSAKNDVIIAVKPAGAITFYSKLNTIDMFGLNNKWIAHNGEFNPASPPGHQKKTNLAYLVKRKVNLVISHPLLVISPQKIPKYYDFQFISQTFIDAPKPLFTKLLNTTKILEIPIDSQRTLITWYLTPSKIVDDVILKHQLRTRPIRTIRPN